MLKHWEKPFKKEKYENVLINNDLMEPIYWKKGVSNKEPLSLGNIKNDVIKIK